jgi:toxin ParE1/3/4
MKVVIREKAYDDVERIFAYIAKGNPIAAKAVILWIFGAIEQLGLFPRMGRSGTVEGTRERVVSRLPYIIVYRLNEAREELVVIAIFHAAQER